MNIEPMALLALLADLQTRLTQVTTERDQLAQVLAQQHAQADTMQPPT